MERKDFLKRGFGLLGMAVIAPSILGGSKAAACTVPNTETAGPFPTIAPASLVRSNIIGTRTGIDCTINMTLKNVNNSCNPISGIMVDIWHCDKDGNYSQYGGTPMQAADYTAQDFLRGRQTSDSLGKISFSSIFPGWYSGRATHIHVHVYDAAGTSLLITQIAFPEGSGSAVETVNAATAYGYTKGMTGYTYNAADNVFDDGTATQMSCITGSVATGYILEWDCFISGTTNIQERAAENQFQIRQNFPNPCTGVTKIPVVLKVPSTVNVSVLSTDGKVVMTQLLGNMGIGEQYLDLNVAALPAGNYVYSVKLTNLSGSFTQSKLFIKE